MEINNIEKELKILIGNQYEMAKIYNQQKQQRKLEKNRAEKLRYKNSIKSTTGYTFGP